MKRLVVRKIPRFSVIMPVYNVASYLPEALESVFGQIFKNWECICVNDGSRDSSDVILDDYVRRDARLRVCHQRNKGAGNARNRGLTDARGEWLLFLDGDDFYVLHLMKQLNGLIDKYPQIDMVVFRHTSNLEKSVMLSIENNAKMVTVFESKQRIPMEMVVNNFCDRAYRKSIGAKIRFPERTMCEDVLYHFLWCDLVRSFLTTDSQWYVYRKRSDSTTQTLMTPKKITDAMEVWLQIGRVFNRSNKAVDKAIFKHISWWLSVWPVTMAQKLSRGHAQVVWQALFVFYSQIWRESWCSLWCRFLTIIGCITRSSKVCIFYVEGARHIKNIFK